MKKLFQRIYHKLHDTVYRAFERYDLTTWDVPLSVSLPIYGVYHVYCDTNWQDMVTEQIKALKASGLLEQTAKLYVNCIGQPQDIEELRRIICSDKMELIAVVQDSRQYEYPALKFLHEKSQQEDALFYYFHTKGISYQALKVKDKRFKRFKRNIEAWRNMMEYFLFDKWRVAVNVLTYGNYDTYGCYRLPPPPAAYYLYAGNFWWSRSSYLRRLPIFTPSQFSVERFSAETWLYKAKPHDFSAFDTMADLYYVYIPPVLYHDAEPPYMAKFRFIAWYNIRKFRKQILGYDYKKHYQLRYQRIR